MTLIQKFKKIRVRAASSIRTQVFLQIDKD